MKESKRRMRRFQYLKTLKYIIAKNPEKFNVPMLGYSNNFSDYGKNNNFSKESFKRLKESGRDKELVSYVDSFKKKVNLKISKIKGEIQIFKIKNQRLQTPEIGKS